ncbi:eCIS core domain-containing protein [Herbaspirillum rubrisubalbicans]|uniref:eCIS core domain-containing protein n=1 Tax=Herbaspirillum rubrisubalbicans TaxID=80842 RepID=UPI00155A037A|nr:DUF4157 domain-containing protein [Herbaspirillum rubrisubalbicans]NQE46899.1 hypothetical protein [Herbaspirillum rubrisubalbicans]
MSQYEELERKSAQQGGASAVTQGRAVLEDQRADGPIAQKKLAGSLDAASPRSGRTLAGHNSTGLPRQLKAGVESLSGMSMNHVHVQYNSSRPAQLNAHAYAQGSDIHLAPGQEKHLPHEAWHVVQQAQGRVRPTMQMKAGLPVNDDAGLEHEADVMGARAVQLSAAENVSPASAVISTAGRGTVQRKIGFEMEYAIPLMQDAVTYKGLLSKSFNAAGTQRIARYLLGGPSYDNENALFSGQGFKVVNDKELQLMMANRALLEALEDDRMINEIPTGTKPAGIPEYVTDAVDELAPLSTARISGILGAVSQHMGQAFAVASGEQPGALPGASGYSVGFPGNDILNYYRQHKKSLKKIEPAVKSVKDAIKDRIAPQVTVGIIPSSLTEIHNYVSTSGVMDANQKSSDKEREYAPRIARATELGNRYAAEVMQVLTKRVWFGHLAPIEQDQLSGIVTLITHYIVGESYCRSDEFEPYKVVKNAVPLMAKIDLGTVRSAAPGLAAKLPGQMQEDTARAIKDHPLFAPATVLSELKTKRRNLKDDENGDAGILKKESPTELTDKVLSGKTVDHRGKRFNRHDTLAPTLAAKLDGQKGVQLEFRRIAARPGHAEMTAMFMAIVDKTREINLKHLSSMEKQAIINAANTTLENASVPDQRKFSQETTALNRRAAKANVAAIAKALWARTKAHVSNASPAVLAVEGALGAMTAIGVGVALYTGLGW